MGSPRQRVAQLANAWAQGRNDRISGEPNRNPYNGNPRLGQGSLERQCWYRYNIAYNRNEPRREERAGRQQEGQLTLF